MGKRVKFGMFNVDKIKIVMDFCQACDVEKGNIFDARAGAVNIYTRPWTTTKDRRKSQLVGTFWVDWKTGQVDVEEESSDNLTAGVLQYLYASIEIDRIRDWELKDEPYYVFKERLQKVEPELTVVEKQRFGLSEKGGKDVNSSN